ncbi:DUF221-domain-containing protein [Lophiostoma macrostomum CBS 122681]|uniref:DUF221-domain-containing protein n=1 Tax=Lophiostoma macrostomum CBS 122681 TaxID=1314788 RepID=A0A6A6T1G4_9PLEO|nr:DUF221-domain-containing protein [Lophiostoma macrostomum CBS 122681]
MSLLRLVRRQSSGSESTTDEFLDLIADPFQAEVQENSIYAAIIWSFAVSSGLFLVFCFLRPRHSLVYAPRAKHADEKHAPQKLDRKPFSWFTAVKVQEEELVDKIGLDAVVFLRFLRMLRDMFIVLTVFGCGILIPVNLVGGHDFYDQWSDIATLMKFTPQYIFGPKFWAYVICAYIFQGTVCFFVWWNYRVVYKLRRAYFNSPDYKASLHSRTLLLTHIPSSDRTDSGIAQLVEAAQQTQDIPRTAIARNVKDLPELIEEHDDTVRELEAVLANYLKDPNKLPRKRPTCRVAKEDRAEFGKQKLDALEYLAGRIARLENNIRAVRESVDKRNPMPYGFASYTHIEDAHAVAYAARKKGPSNCSVYLAPKPHDLLWQNLSMSRATRRLRMFWDTLWMIILTIVFIVPNILTSVFLSDFAHLGLLWKSFQTNLSAHPVGWGIAQGILAPLVQTLMYMGIPVLFRRLYTHSGDISKTSRERHVTARLFAFTVFNNLVVFSIFGSGWRFVASVIAAQDQGIWEAMKSSHLFSKVMTGLCNVSTFWLTWQMQRNLGAATDLVQAFPLIWGFIQRKFFSPTPRQLIELSAPQPFEYADYYNNYLTVATVGFCFGTLQPIILPITAFYIAIDVWFKKYLLQYVFITKTESGGRFWKLLVNRLLVAIMLANAVIALVVGAQGVGSVNSVGNGDMLYAMIPLPLLMALFKWYCRRAFDDRLTYYSAEPYSDAEGGVSGKESKVKRSDRVAVRFGHPALFKRLLTPMVSAKSIHLLQEIYGSKSKSADGHDIFEAPHRRSTDRAMPQTPGAYAYSDIFMATMDPENVGKPDANANPTGEVPAVEVVNEEDIDFEKFKKRAEFSEEFGGDGELYGRPEDLISRPGTPSTMATMTDVGFYKNRQRGSGESSRTKLGDPEASESGLKEGPKGSRLSNLNLNISGEPAQGREENEEEGTLYTPGYQPTPRTDRFDPADVGVDVDIPATPFDVDDILDAGNRPSRVRTGSTSHALLIDRLTDEGAAGYFDTGVRADEDTSYEGYRHGTA